MLLYLTKKLTKWTFKSAVFVGACAAGSVAMTPELQWTDQHQDTPLAKTFGGKATLMDAVQRQVPLNQLCSVAHVSCDPQSPIDLKALSALVAKQILLFEEARTAWFRSTTGTGSTLLTGVASSTQHSGVQEVASTAATYLDKVGRSVAPQPLALNVAGKDANNKSATAATVGKSASTPAVTAAAASTTTREFSNRAELREAILALKLNPGDGYGSLLVDSVAADGVLFSDAWGVSAPSLTAWLRVQLNKGLDSVSGGKSAASSAAATGLSVPALETKTWVAAFKDKADPRMVNIRVGQSYNVNNEIGWLMLPWVASYYFIINRFRLRSAADEVTRR